jgi:hypothetical protein
MKEKHRGPGIGTVRKTQTGGDSSDDGAALQIWVVLRRGLLDAPRIDMAKVVVY